MNYLSVCSGIEAATVAWHSLGWNPVAFSEIEKFPSQVLQHHYPHVPNVGDMTKFKEWNLGSTVNLLVGGTPCQSFSVAGLRKGLDDPRGNLMLTYLAIADKFRPRWLVWENVPGVLSSNGGKDFGTFLGGLGELGYGFAYRILDAQYFGVAQRRRRVFVVGYLGDWRPAAAVLFERHSLCGYPAPSRKERKVTPTLSASGTGVRNVGFNSEDEWFIPQQSFTPSSIGGYAQGVGTLGANGGDIGGGSENLITQPKAYSIREDAKADIFSATPIEVSTAVTALRPSPQSHHAQVFVAQSVDAIPIDTMNHIGRGDDHSFADFQPGAPSYTLTKGHSHAVAYQSAGGVVREIGDVMSTLDAARESRGTNQQRFLMQPVAFAQNQLGEVRTGDVFNTLNTNSNASGRNTPMVVHGTQDPCVGEVAFAQGRNNGGENVLIQPTIQTYEWHNQDSRVKEQSVASTLNCNADGREGNLAQIGMAVRRLTPIECERLQGFPDNYTKINDKAADGPRYKALGNSMAVPVMNWIGTRIQMFENEISKVST